MKRLINCLLVFAILLSILTGCQKEETVIKHPLPADAITANTTVAGLIEQTTLFDGSSDNIVDHTSCSAVVLPVTVQANGQELTITTPDDFKYIERIFDEYDYDDDSLAIFFPITIIKADHSQLVLQNANELKAIAEQCQEGGSDDDIECIDFVYPIVFSVYNTNYQVANVITITTDSALYEFMDQLEDGVLVSITFPVVMQLVGGGTLTINNNTELENAIDNAKGYCDEDDDNDFEDDDIDDSDFLTTLLEGSWKVNYFFDEQNKTSEFLNYVFTFSADSTVLTTNGTVNVEGEWKVYNDSGKLEFEMEFDVDSDSPFDEIKEDWKVKDYNSTTITLKDHEGEDDEKTLTFGKL